mmetsp:Transcript_27689/g.53401  ORF Transcript_27689/g.53401 Transcript_27689/m.53401 type:complete len:212 (-) Transcript_27689:226-861(-)
MKGTAPWNSHLPSFQRCAEVVSIHAKQPRCSLHTLVIHLHHAYIVIIILNRQWLLILLDVAKMQEPSQNLHSGIYGSSIKTNCLQCITKPIEICSVTGLQACYALSLGGEPVGPVTFKLQLLQPLIVQAPKHLVEAVVSPFPIAMDHNARALQKVRRDACIEQCALFVKKDAIILSKPGGIRVPHRDGVAKGFQDRLSLQDPVLDVGSQVR